MKDVVPWLNEGYTEALIRAELLSCNTIIGDMSVVYAKGYQAVDLILVGDGQAVAELGCRHVRGDRTVFDNRAILDADIRTAGGEGCWH